MKKDVCVLIMAGGVGSRFWPVSRSNFPKQFLDVLGLGKTLIQQTVERFAKFVPLENIYVLTAKEYVPLVLEQVPTLAEENVIGEPIQKNTAPCVLYASFKLLSKHPSASLIVAPSDHLIKDEASFMNICLQGLSFTEHTTSLITLGIQPNFPSTGYGYIQKEGDEKDGVFRVKQFIEKPYLELAKTFFKSSDYLWNAGIFIWKLQVILEAFKTFLPDVYNSFDDVKEQLNTSNEEAVVREIFSNCPSISIDYAILEKADYVFTIPSNFGWNDLGTWSSAWDNMEQDYLKNAANTSHVVLLETERCIIHSAQNKLVLVQGLEDYIVADTPDVLMICKREKEQEIKLYQSEVKEKFGGQFLNAPRINVPGTNLEEDNARTVSAA
jgi:mannose-1-phosphate guanylyltransferase